VVKNVAGYDLPKLMSGALGTLGIITRAVFRLHPLPQESKTLSFSFLNREKANEFMLSIADSVVVPTGLQMRTGASGNIAVDVRIDGIAAGVAAQAETVCKLAGNVNPFEPSSSMSNVDPWQAREQLWSSGASATLCKLSLLPTQLSSTAEFIREALSDNADWTLLMHSTGLAWLQLDAADCARIADFISSIRAFLASSGGTAVVLKAPPLLRQKVDLWGSAGTALPLMKRIKEQFDPRGILNRGRFVGEYDGANNGAYDAGGNAAFVDCFSRIPRNTRCAERLRFTSSARAGVDRPVRALRLLSSHLPNLPALERGDGFSARPYLPHENGCRRRRGVHGQKVRQPL